MKLVYETSLVLIKKLKIKLFEWVVLFLKQTEVKGVKVTHYFFSTAFSLYLSCPHISTVSKNDTPKN